MKTGKIDKLTIKLCNTDQLHFFQATKQGKRVHGQTATERKIYIAFRVCPTSLAFSKLR